MTDQLTVGAVVANTDRGARDDIAAIVGGQRLSFGDLDTAGGEVAAYLVAAGLAAGDVALVVADTTPAMLELFIGCARAGVVFAPLNPALDAATVRAVADMVQPAVVITSPEHADSASAVKAPRLLVTDCRSQRSDAGLPDLSAHDPHVAFFTSGSTGPPKGAVLSHGTSVLRSHPGSQLEPRGSALCPYPLFHMAGWTISLQQWHTPPWCS